jgi:hypothetical protein
MKETCSISPFHCSAAQQQAKGGNILFVRGETQGQDRDGTETSRVINPDEINIDYDEDDEAEEDADDSEYTVKSEFNNISFKFIR